MDSFRRISGIFRVPCQGFPKDSFRSSFENSFGFLSRAFFENSATNSFGNNIVKFYSGSFRKLQGSFPEFLKGFLPEILPGIFPSILPGFSSDIFLGIPSVFFPNSSRQFLQGLLKVFFPNSSRDSSKTFPGKPRESLPRFHRELLQLQGFLR